jgi:stringent starvation protein B
VDELSTKPYIIRAIHEWCCDNGFTPYISVIADDRARLPREFIRDGQIVLNVGYDASNNLKIGNEHITFQARFGGVARELMVPISNVAAIYARESGAGMAFEVESYVSIGSSPVGLTRPASSDSSETAQQPDPPIFPRSGHPKLQRIK